jgi:hypothetical protein
MKLGGLMVRKMVQEECFQAIKIAMRVIFSMINVDSEFLLMQIKLNIRGSGRIIKDTEEENGYSLMDKREKLHLLTTKSTE